MNDSQRSMALPKHLAPCSKPLKSGWNSGLKSKILLTSWIMVDHGGSWWCRLLRGHRFFTKNRSKAPPLSKDRKVMAFCLEGLKQEALPSNQGTICNIGALLKISGIMGYNSVEPAKLVANCSKQAVSSKVWWDFRGINTWTSTFGWFIPCIVY